MRGQGLSSPPVFAFPCKVVSKLKVPTFLQMERLDARFFASHCGVGFFRCPGLVSAGASLQTIEPANPACLLLGAITGQHYEQWALCNLVKVSEERDDRNPIPSHLAGVPTVARLIISTSGFSTGKTILRCRWFDGENDGCRRVTTFVLISVPGISTSYATEPRLLESTTLQFGASAQGLRVGMIRWARPTTGRPSNRMTPGFRVRISSSVPLHLLGLSYHFFD